MRGVKATVIQLFLFLCMLVCSNRLLAQRAVPYDTSNIVARSIDEKAIKTYSEDTDFQYNRYKEPPKSIWDKFWNWFWWKVSQVMSTKGGRVTVWSVLIIVSAAIILFFVMKVTGMKDGGVFGRKSEGGLAYSLVTDDINQISFEEAIEQAVSQGNFRLALRLLYLQSLKKLSDKGYIEWQINKTNSDYLFEVLNRPWYSLFRSLTWRFEYAWYGEENVAKDEFDRLQTQFQQFNNQL